jgi:predicted ribosome-associated RNA-binding protein Tma20
VDGVALVLDEANDVVVDEMAVELLGRGSSVMLK